MSDTVLKVMGQVQSPRDLTRADLQSIDDQFQIADVSQLVPSRRGRAVTLAGIVSLARPEHAVDYLTLHATADDFHASVPLGAVSERGFFIYEVDGQPLEPSAGGPVRFFIPDHAACHSAEVDECANVKFVDCVEFSVGKGRDNRPQDDDEHEALHRGEN